ncbi:MAG: SEC-C metal-binding domain-containing protein [Planctomycetota bacterium]
MDQINRRQVRRVLQQSVKAGKNEDLLLTAERHRKQGFAWRYDGLTEWSTDAIFAKLHELGVNTDPQRFREQAQAARRPMSLEEQWWKGVKRARTFWDDFPLLAAEELWRRLTPELYCPELLADRLDEVIHRSSEHRGATPEDDQRDVEAALLLIAFLEGFPPEERAARLHEVEECSVCDHGSWLLCFVLNHGKRYSDEVTRVADVMSSFDEAANYQGDLAVALAWAGRNEQALDRVRANLKRFPEDVWVRIKAGDVFTELDDDPEALTLYSRALAIAREPFDWDGAAERIIDLLRRMGRSDDWKEVERKHPRPDRNVNMLPRHASPSPRKASSDQPVFPPQAQKAGRNDPCPCGSGRKYKKCCLGRA